MQNQTSPLPRPAVLPPYRNRQNSTKKLKITVIASSHCRVGTYARPNRGGLFHRAFQTRSSRRPHHPCPPQKSSNFNKKIENHRHSVAHRHPGRSPSSQRSRCPNLRTAIRLSSRPALPSVPRWPGARWPHNAVLSWQTYRNEIKRRQGA
jgi:hypothetical protein